MKTLTILLALCVAPPMSSRYIWAYSRADDYSILYEAVNDGVRTEYYNRGVFRHDTNTYHVWDNALQEYGPPRTCPAPLPARPRDEEEVKDGAVSDQPREEADKGGGQGVQRSTVSLKEGGPEGV